MAFHTFAVHQSISGEGVVQRCSSSPRNRPTRMLLDVTFQISSRFPSSLNLSLKITICSRQIGKLLVGLQCAFRMLYWQMKGLLNGKRYLESTHRSIRTTRGCQPSTSSLPPSKKYFFFKTDTVSQDWAKPLELESQIAHYVQCSWIGIILP